jgi:hypothetical protein
MRRRVRDASARLARKHLIGKRIWREARAQRRFAPERQ